MDVQLLSAVFNQNSMLCVCVFTDDSHILQKDVDLHC